jgi:hypothetical protein
MMRIYVASSWRNGVQPSVISFLREAGHEVYDFRNPSEGDIGFHWSEIDPAWQQWSFDAYRSALSHPVADAGFKSDFDAMKWADACVLVLPCGRSAHLEAGWFAGAGKPLVILILEKCEPELMYKMADSICLSMDELLSRLEEYAAQQEPEQETRYVTREMALDAGDPDLEGQKL